MATEAAHERVETSWTNNEAPLNNAEEPELANHPRSSSSPNVCEEKKSEDKRSFCLQRLPTIQIDTVPSMPPSPTEWSPPPPEDVLHELNEALDESEIDLEVDQKDKESISAQIQEFASTYVEEIISKAMEVVDERWRREDADAARWVAAEVVDDVISKATEMVSAKREKQPRPLSHPDGLPMIHIDTVVSAPPSPTEEEEEAKVFAEAEKQKKTEICNEVPRKPARKVKKGLRITYQDSDEEEEVEKAQADAKVTSEQQTPDIEEVREFAASYVKDIISRAITLAEEKLVPTVPFNFEDVNLMKTSGPWYIRARETLIRVLRSACFCTPRRADS